MLFICQELVDRFPALWGSLRSELARLETECEIIPGENPWIRDYMPVRIPGLGLVQFRYAPKYHQKARYRESEVVHVPKPLSQECFKLDWVMDGGGVLADDSVVLLSAKFPPPAPAMLKIFDGKSPSGQAAMQLVLHPLYLDWVAEQNPLPQFPTTVFKTHVYDSFLQWIQGHPANV